MEREEKRREARKKVEIEAKANAREKRRRRAEEEEGEEAEEKAACLKSFNESSQSRVAVHAAFDQRHNQGVLM